MLTASQIKWAASHDWFVSDNGDGTITVLTMEMSDPIGATMIFSGSFRELRDWAGY